MTPKARLLADKDLTKFVRQVTDDHRFLTAADAALLELVRSLPDTTNQVDAVAHFNRIVGARNFLAGLLTVADQSKPLPVPDSTAKLNYNA